MLVPSQEQPAKQAARWERSNFQGNWDGTESTVSLTHRAALISPVSSPFAFLVQPVLCQKSGDVAHPESSLLALQLLRDF